MSRLSSGNCSSVCLRRSESGRGPLESSRSVKALENGSRRSCAAYSNVSNWRMTGNGSSGGAGRARTSATQFWRLGASPGVLVTPREQPASATASAASATRRPAWARSWICTAMSALLPFLQLGDLILVEIAVGLHRARQFQRRIGPNAGLAVAARLQRNVVHGHDHHARQRGHAADEATELVVAADHAQGNRLFGVELLRHFRAGLEQLVGDARGDGGLRDVGDQVRHLGLARQLAQHLLQLLLHVRQLLLERLQVGGPALLLLELAAQLGLGALQSAQGLAL